MSVYSTAFIVVHDMPIVVGSSYTVPTGFVAIVKELDVYYGGPSVVDIKAIHSRGPAVFWRESFSLALAGWRQWRGSVVLEAGEMLTLLGGDFMDGYAGGYLLPQ